jgi:DNA-binding PadR family transcriptional regulator
MTDDKLDLPQGTLDLLILKTLSLEPQHGWAISERLHQVSRATLQIPQGSLYPALHRLERRGWIKAEWGASDTIAAPSTTASRAPDANSSSARRRPGTS